MGRRLTRHLRRAGGSPPPAERGLLAATSAATALIVLATLVVPHGGPDMRRAAELGLVSADTRDVRFTVGSLQERRDVRVEPTHALARL